MNHVTFMRQALELARRAASEGEVPVGAVLVRDDEVIAAEWNSPIRDSDPTAHAELKALRSAAKQCGNYRLEDCVLYVTLEPCAMCAGALVNARIRDLVFGARDLRFGAVRSKFRLADSSLLNHQVAITEGVLGAESTELLVDFFRERR